MRLQDDDLLVPLLGFAALTAWHVLGQAGEDGEYIARLDLLPVHARFEIHLGVAAMRLLPQDFRVRRFYPKARDVHGHLEEFFRGLAARDAAIVVQQDSLRAQGPRFDVGVARAKSHQCDTAR